MYSKTQINNIAYFQQTRIQCTCEVYTVKTSLTVSRLLISDVGLVPNIAQQRWPISNWLELKTGLQFDHNGSAQCNIFREASSKPSEAFQSLIPSSLVRFIGDSAVTSRGCGSL